MAPEKENTPQEKATEQPLIMQIIVRRDLLDAKGWGIGPLMAQVAHATSAVLHETRDRPETIEYLDDLNSMHKSLSSSPQSSEKSSAPAPLPPHHLWTEQPENEPTCIALAPSRRGDKAVRRVLDKAGCRVWR
ncbi:hypothetical protein OF83DRAFT_1065708 [Amylostereum chailletii]|nr:hypothetical protein OF83DRAFT_1065708 [Amylostereum chailletii]